MAPAFRSALGLRSPTLLAFPVYPDDEVFRAIEAFAQSSSNVPIDLCAVLEELGRWGYCWVHDAKTGRPELLVDEHGCNRPSKCSYALLLDNAAAHNPYRHLERPKPDRRNK